jgi:hypothetical protein
LQKLRGVRFSFILLLFCLMLPFSLLSIGIEGKYIHDFYGEKSYLELREVENEIRGEFHDDRGSYKVVASIEGERAIGTMDFFERKKHVEIFNMGDILHFVIVDYLANGKPDYTHPYEIQFVRDDGAFMPNATSNFAVENENLIIKSGSVNAPYIGIRFDLPEGLEAQNNGTEIILVGKHEPGFVLIFRHDHITIDDMLNFIKDGYKDEELDIKPSSEIKLMMDSAYKFDLSGRAEGKKAKGHGVITLSNNGHGVIIFSIVEEAQYHPRHEDYAEIVAKSLYYFEVENHPLGIQWSLDLRGKSLKRAYKKGEIKQGAGEDNVKLTPWLNLCHQDVYQKIEPTDDGDKNLYTGRWGVVVHYGIPYLELMRSDGHQSNYALRAMGGKLYLEEDRWLVLDGFKCR